MSRVRFVKKRCIQIQTMLNLIHAPWAEVKNQPLNQRNARSAAFTPHHLRWFQALLVRWHAGNGPVLD
jgi:hypothetical protein